MGRRVSLAIVALCLVIMAMAPLPAAAQGLPPYDAVAQADAKLRTAIPVGVFHNSSDIGTIPAGARVTVLEERNIVGFAATDQWLYVQVPNGGSGQSGWTYNGVLGGPKYFLVVP